MMFPVVGSFVALGTVMSLLLGAVGNVRAEDGVTTQGGEKNVVTSDVATMERLSKERRVA